MSLTGAELSECQTEHGLLIAFGEFAHYTGLISGLMDVRIPQKVQRQVGAVPPQTKLIELSAGLLTGMEYLQDLSLGHHPLAKDQAVAEAWGQARLVHYSNVSRTLEACDEITVQDLRAVIARFNQPFIAEAIHDELRAGREIVFDLDLTGQPVSSTSHVYPDVAFGWMNNQIRLGYQLARVCVQTERYGRIWLEGFHHPGDTVSMHCVKELILAAEQHAGVRPRRRPECVTQRIEKLQPSIRRREGACTRQVAALTTVKTKLGQRIGQFYQLGQLSKKKMNPTQNERISRRISTVGARLDKLQSQLAHRQTILTRQRERLQKILAEQERLLAWRTQLEEDNRLNPNAPLCVCRNDAGFCSGENLTWQIEMGYQVETKSSSGKITVALQKRCSAQTPWTRVGQNAAMVDWVDYRMKECPYPLRVGLERFSLGQQTKHSVLIMYRDSPHQPGLPQWFKHYNGRQIIEAGNKQMKTIHHVQHLMSHAKYGIQIQVLLTGLVCNQTQFIQPWLQSAAKKLTPQIQADLGSPKTMVRIMANSTASVQRSTSSTVLVFDKTSAIPDFKLCLHGLPLHQLNLGLFQPLPKNRGNSLILPLVAQPLR
jgi:hypothetical protein